MGKKRLTGNDGMRKYLDLPSGIMGGVHIEMFSNGELIVDGIKGISEYDDCYIVLSLPKNNLTVTGHNLEIADLSEKEVTVIGKITSLEFLSKIKGEEIV